MKPMEQIIIGVGMSLFWVLAAHFIDFQLAIFAALGATLGTIYGELFTRR